MLLPCFTHFILWFVYACMFFYLPVQGILVSLGQLVYFSVHGQQHISLRHKCHFFMCWICRLLSFVMPLIQGLHATCHRYQTHNPWDGGSFLVVYINDWMTCRVLFGDEWGSKDWGLIFCQPKKIFCSNRLVHGNVWVLQNREQERINMTGRLPGKASWGYGGVWGRSQSSPMLSHHPFLVSLSMLVERLPLT